MNRIRYLLIDLAFSIIIFFILLILFKIIFLYSYNAMELIRHAFVLFLVYFLINLFLYKYKQGRYYLYQSTFPTSVHLQLSNYRKTNLALYVSRLKCFYLVALVLIVHLIINGAITNNKTKKPVYSRNLLILVEAKRLSDKTYYSSIKNINDLVDQSRLTGISKKFYKQFSEQLFDTLNNNVDYFINKTLVQRFKERAEALNKKDFRLVIKNIIDKISENMQDLSFNKIIEIITEALETITYTDNVDILFYDVYLGAYNTITHNKTARTTKGQYFELINRNNRKNHAVLFNDYINTQINADRLRITGTTSSYTFRLFNKFIINDLISKEYKNYKTNENNSDKYEFITANNVESSTSFNDKSKNLNIIYITVNNPTEYIPQSSIKNTIENILDKPYREQGFQDNKIDVINFYTGSEENNPQVFGTRKDYNSANTLKIYPYGNRFALTPQLARKLYNDKSFNFNKYFDIIIPQEIDLAANSTSSTETGSVKSKLKRRRKNNRPTKKTGSLNYHFTYFKETYTRRKLEQNFNTDRLSQARRKEILNEYFRIFNLKYVKENEAYVENLNPYFNEYEFKEILRGIFNTSTDIHDNAMGSLYFDVISLDIKYLFVIMLLLIINMIINIFTNQHIPRIFFHEEAE